MSDALLGCRGVKLAYRTGKRALEILKGVDLEVREGECLAITGLSGAGKSTLLNVLGGLCRPDEGCVEWKGKDVYRMGEGERSRWRAREVGFVFQSYHLLPEMTIEENVLLAGLNLPGGWLRGKALRERASGLLERVGLGGRRAHRPNELSGGEQQRAALARALMNHPKLLLADEPTGNLDAQTGEDVMRCLFELRETEGLTVAMVTHNEELAGRCTRRVRMEEGRIA
ncbi:MAG: ABC transporter ATP-binding protein [Kiritimatiellae bacterium]|nr:ABC transporter ATP-binding protein [Kiritimatiellia bacterium]